MNKKQWIEHSRRTGEAEHLYRSATDDDLANWTRACIRIRSLAALFGLQGE